MRTPPRRKEPSSPAKPLIPILRLTTFWLGTTCLVGTLLRRVLRLEWRTTDQCVLAHLVLLSLIYLRACNLLLLPNAFLLVATDYFTKWVEAEPMTEVTTTQVIGFIKRNIIH